MSTTEQEPESILNTERSNPSHDHPQNPDPLLISKEIALRYEAMVADAKKRAKSSDTPEVSLKKIIDINKDLEDITKGLEEFIDEVTNNRSYFTEFAEQWGQMPYWEKILGLLVPVSVLVSGMALFAAIPLIVGGTLTAVYTGAGLMLEDHYHKTISISDALKKKVMPIVNVFGTIMLSFWQATEQLHAQIAVLEEQVDTFKQENVKLKQSVSTLQFEVQNLERVKKDIEQTQKKQWEQIHINENQLATSKSQIIDMQKKIDELTSQINRLESANGNYEQQNKALGQKIATLNQGIEDNNKIIQEYQQTIDQLIFENRISQDDLKKTNAQLEESQKNLTQDLDRVQLVAQSLEGSVRYLSGMCISNEKDREQFTKKLDDFLTNSAAHFWLFNSRLTETQKALEHTKDDLISVKEDFFHLYTRFEELLLKQEKYINILKELSELKRKIDLPQRITSTLDRVGLYKNDRVITLGSNDSPIQKNNIQLK